MSRNNWDCGEFFAAGFGPRVWAYCGSEGPSGRGRGRQRGRRRQQMFESGEMKYVILRLIKEKPRHGYEIIKALEEKFGGWYTPSAGTVYPTLQLLEDQGYVRINEVEGKKVYHITPEGEAFLEEHRDVLEDIIDRVHEVVRDLAGGTMADLNEAFARMAGLAYKQAWKTGSDNERTQKVVEILRRALKEMEETLAT